MDFFPQRTIFGLSQGINVLMLIDPNMHEFTLAPSFASTWKQKT